MSEELNQQGPLLRRVMAFAVTLACFVVILPATEADLSVEKALTAQVAARDLGDAVKKAYPNGLNAQYQGDMAARELIAAEWRRKGIKVDLDAQTLHRVVLQSTDNGVRLSIDGAAIPIVKERHVGGWTAILPPLIAVLIALYFRRLLIALGAAVWLGATQLAGWNPVLGLWAALKTYVWANIASEFNAYIILFTLALVGMVQVMTRAGGVQGVIDQVRGLARGRRSTQLATVAMGGAVFFDDYANTVVVGTTMRHLTDARRISREKLAYIVDSTSAPIAGVAIISTWIGYEVGLFDDLSLQLGLTKTLVSGKLVPLSGYDIFFTILPLRFYCWFTLVFVVLVAATGRDFGPMLKAELRAAKTGATLNPGSKPMTSNEYARLEVAEGVRPRWWNAAIPIAVVMVATFVGMFWSGWSLGDASIPGVFSGEFAAILAGWSQAVGDMLSWSAWRDAFSNADNAKVLFWSSILGSVAAIGLSVTQRQLGFGDAIKTWLAAIPAMWMAVAILVLAWSIRGVCDDLGTNVYLVGAVQDYLTPAMLPLATFLLAAAVAFSTGTSWGTMGILLPAMIPLAFQLTQGEPNAMMLVFLCFGAVLDGAIFGDHCSPISDTTVLSSISASCDHVDHVRTQIPYALTTMTGAAILGYLGVALGMGVLAVYILALVAMVAVLFVVGKRVTL